MMDKKLVDALRNESRYKDKATLEIMDLCMAAADRIEALEERFVESERERERVAAVELAGKLERCIYVLNAAAMDMQSNPAIAQTMEFAMAAIEGRHSQQEAEEDGGGED